MKHITYTEENFAIIQFSGDIDLYTTPDMKKIILTPLKEGLNVAVDLKEVSYIDSSGLAVLIEGFKYAQKHYLTFGVLRLSDFARNVFELANLDKIFPIFGSVDEWKDSMKK